MFTRSFRPLSRSVIARVGAATALGATAVVGYASLEQNRVHADATGVRNWDASKGQYDEDLKRNRHKEAFENGGKVPLSPINNTASRPEAHHVASKKQVASGVTSWNEDDKKRGTAKVNPESGKTEQPAGLDTVQKKADEAQAEEGQTAFNEETGEINWDCPCLGGMAHGPCGENFREAFSCFVYSKEEPKGIDCVEKFKGMQDCFRKHPDVYGAELEDDDEFANAAPLSEPVKAEADHSGFRDTPSLPNKEPPSSSPIIHQTHLNNPSKGVQKLQPKSQKGKEQAASPEEQKRFTTYVNKQEHLDAEPKAKNKA